MGELLVSINCTTYNQEKYIADAIESFLMQITDFNYEILIGEDCSKDNTRKIVEQYANLYPEKIRLITSDQNVGAKRNAQRLIDSSKGKYIAECEGDDYWTDPYKLQRQVDYMEGHPECSLCFHAAEIIKAPHKTTAMKISPYTIDKKSPLSDIISEGGGFCPTASLLYRKKNMENPPEFYHKAHVSDYPKQIFLASKGYAYYFEKQMSVYRIGVKGSWSNRKKSGESIREKMISINKEDISLLTGFNKLTHFSHKEDIENTIIKKEFEIDLLTGKKNVLKNIKYQEYINRLNMKQKFKIYSRCFSPSIYVNIASLKPYLYKYIFFANIEKGNTNARK